MNSAQIGHCRSAAFSSL